MLQILITNYISKSKFIQTTDILDFCQSKMLQIHIKSHLPLWYHYTSFQHLEDVEVWSLTNNRKFKKKSKIKI